MIRLLILSAILIIGCAPSRPILTSVNADPTCIKKFIPEFQSTWYNTSIDVVGKHLSGLLLIKTLDDQSQRLVFTNEAGVKFFDFGFDQQGNFKVYQVISSLNKKAVINLLKKDFELMLMIQIKNQSAKAFQRGEENLFFIGEGKEVDYVITTTDCSKLVRLEKWGRKSKMTEITFESLSSIPDGIQIKHFNFDMDIKMKKINR